MLNASRLWWDWKPCQWFPNNFERSPILVRASKVMRWGKVGSTRDVLSLSKEGLGETYLLNIMLFGPRLCLFMPFITSGSPAKVSFSFWVRWHWTVSDHQVIIFSQQPHAQGEKKHLERVGFEPGSSCSESDCSSHKPLRHLNFELLMAVTCLIQQRDYDTTRVPHGCTDFKSVSLHTFSNLRSAVQLVNLRLRRN